MNRFALCLILLLPAARIGAETLGPEIPVSAPEYGIPTNVTGVASASNGNGFLTVWKANDRFFASRFSETGELLDPTGFPLSEEHWGTPVVASAGGNYLVASASRWQIIRADGSLLPAVIPEIGLPGYKPLIASNGTHYLVVTFPLSAVILDPDLGRSVTVALPEGFEPTRSVAGDPSGFLIVGTRSFFVEILKIDLEGQVVFHNTLPEQLPGYASVLPQSTATNGSEYLVVWSAASELRAARLSMDGRVISRGFSLSVGASSTFAVTSEGADFIVFVAGTEEDKQLRAVTVRGDAVLGIGFILELPLSAFIPDGSFAVASGSGKHLISTVEVVQPIEPRGKAFTGAITRLYDHPDQFVERVVPTAFSAAMQFSPAAASDGENLLVAWSEFDRHKGMYSVLANLVDPDRSALLNKPISLFDFPSSQLSAKVAFDGVNYLVIWEENGGIVGQFVTRQGEKTGERFIIGMGGIAPTLTFGGSQYLVTWVTNPGYAAARVTPSGVVLDPEPIRFPSDIRPSGPSIAWNGDRFVLVWLRTVATCPRFCFEWSPVGATVDAEGRVKPFAADLDAPRTRIMGDARPDIACNEELCVAVWATERTVNAVILPGNLERDRSRRVVRGVRRTPNVIANNSDWTVPRIIRRNDGFLVTVNRFDGTSLAIHLDREGRRRFDRSMPNTPPSGDLYEIGEDAAFVYTRQTIDRIYGGAHRVFVQSVE